MSASRRKTRQRVKNWFIYILVKTGLRWIRGVKRQTAIGAFQTLSRLGFYLARSERQKTIEHLTMVYGTEKSHQEICRMAKDETWRMRFAYRFIIRATSIKL